MIHQRNAILVIAWMVRNLSYQEKSLKQKKANGQELRQALLACVLSPQLTMEDGWMSIGLEPKNKENTYNIPHPPYPQLAKAAHCAGQTFNPAL